MKKILLFPLFFILLITANAQSKSHQLSSHILDISEGKPVPNVKVTLQKLDANNQWTNLETYTTDDNGRIGNFLPVDANKPNNGTYKLVFKTFPYFKDRNIETFYPFIEVVFNIHDNKHYHVPITISPFGYSTYRGS